MEESRHGLDPIEQASEQYVEKFLANDKYLEYGRTQRKTLIETCVHDVQDAFEAGWKARDESNWANQKQREKTLDEVFAWIAENFEYQLGNYNLALNSIKENVSICHWFIKALRKAMEQ